MTQEQTTSGERTVHDVTVVADRFGAMVRPYGSVQLAFPDRFWRGVRLSAPFSFLICPAGEAMRRVQDGPDVPGPWAEAWLDATILDGTKQERQIVKPGDVLDCGAGGRWVLAVDGRGYPSLTLAD